MEGTRRIGRFHYRSGRAPSYSSDVGVLVVNRGDLVVAEVVETITVDEAFGLLDLMAARADESGAHQGLIVIDEASGLLDTLDRHKLGIRAAEVCPRTMLLAFAAPSHLTTPMFSETVRDRGLTVKVFDDEADAETWLAW